MPFESGRTDNDTAEAEEPIVAKESGNGKVVESAVFAAVEGIGSPLADVIDNVNDVLVEWSVIAEGCV